MNEFDQRMKEKAQQEEMQINPLMEARMEQKLYAAEEPKKKKGLEFNILAVPAMLGGVALALAVLLAVMMQPTADNTLGGLLPQETNQPAMVPVTQGRRDEQPDVSSDVTFTGDTVQMTSWLENPRDDDIWLIKWQPTLEGAQQQPSIQLIWLEPGAVFSQTYEWSGVESDAANVRTFYTAYRVTAHTLHWMEDEALVQDAFEAEALILNPGEWANGQAGEMRLVLPEDQPQDPLTYYIEKGMLTEGFSADETLTAERMP